MHGPFDEFEEIGLNAKGGYKPPGDLRIDHPKFHWDVVSPYVQDTRRYLRVAQNGTQWIANLQANMFG